jgi:hypothetical protein
MQMTQRIENEPLKPEFLVGKTISGINAYCVNELYLWFTDGTRLSIHIDSANGLPTVAACNTCFPEDVRPQKDVDDPGGPEAI